MPHDSRVKPAPRLSHAGAARCVSGAWAGHGSPGLPQRAAGRPAAPAPPHPGALFGVPLREPAACTAHACTSCAEPRGRSGGTCMLACAARAQRECQRVPLAGADQRCGAAADALLLGTTGASRPRHLSLDPESVCGLSGGQLIPAAALVGPAGRATLAGHATSGVLSVEERECEDVLRPQSALAHTINQPRPSRAPDRRHVCRRRSAAGLAPRAASDSLATHGRPLLYRNSVPNALRWDAAQLQR